MKFLLLFSCFFYYYYCFKLFTDADGLHAKWVLCSRRIFVLLLPWFYPLLVDIWYMKISELSTSAFPNICSYLHHCDRYTASGVSIWYFLKDCYNLSRWHLFLTIVFLNFHGLMIVSLCFSIFLLNQDCMSIVCWYFIFIRVKVFVFSHRNIYVCSILLSELL